MEILIVVCLLVGAFFLGAKGGAGTRKPVIDQLSRASAQDRMDYLNTLRRELANYLVWDDPARFQRLHELLRLEVSTYVSMTAAARSQRLAELSKKYPLYSDFDVIATRVYVLYPDAIRDFEELELAYRNIASFQALNIASDPYWKHFTVTDAQESEHLAKYVRRIQDTKLRLDIERAVREYYRADQSRDVGPYDTPDYTVQKVHHFAENRLGILVKASNEYGLYGFFVSDKNLPDGSPKIYYSFFRSDFAFQSEGLLDDLRAVTEWRRSPSGRDGGGAVAS